MKKILTILFILLSVKGYSQNTNPQFLGTNNSNVIVQAILNLADSPKSSINLLLPDTATAKTYFSGKLRGRWARQAGRLYYNPSGSRFVLADSITSSGGGGTFDTTEIYNQLALRVRYIDTQSMLANYATDAQVAAKLDIVDTANIRLRPIAGANMTISGTYPNLTFASSAGGGAFYDSVLMATNYRVDTAKAAIRASIPSTSGFVPYTGATSDVNLGTHGISAHDATINYTSGSGVALSVTKAGSGEGLTVVKSSGSGNAASITGGITLLDELYLNTDLADAYIASAATWNAKQSPSDTTTWDATKQNLADTSAVLRALIPTAISAASVAEINTGTDNTKFASALGLEGSKYVEQDGTKNYAVTTGTATAYVLATTPSFTPTTGTILYVKFHLANTGAATINVNGSGAVALQKDLSTALVANDIPINQEYTIRRTTTGWLIEDIGFAGRNTSARLLGSLTDATGGGSAMFGTTPTVTTSILGSATFSAFNTVTTNLSFAGAATTFTEGGTPTTGLTATYFGNATASGQTKTLNFGTGGASGSTTAINIGSATSGATNNVRINVLPASDATGDIWYRNASGFLTRLGIGTAGQVLTVASGVPSWAAAGGGGISGLTTNYLSKATSSTTIGNSIVHDDGTNIGVGGTAYNVKIRSYGVIACANSSFADLTDPAGASISMGHNGTVGFIKAWSSTPIDLITNIGVAVVDAGSSSPAASAMLDVQSTTKGFLPPRMTGTQAAAIASKAEGLMVYVTDTSGGFAAKGWYGWNGAAWEKLNP